MGSPSLSCCDVGRRGAAQRESPGGSLGPGAWLRRAPFSSARRMQSGVTRPPVAAPWPACDSVGGLRGQGSARPSITRAFAAPRESKYRLSSATPVPSLVYPLIRAFPGTGRRLVRILENPVLVLALRQTRCAIRGYCGLSEPPFCIWKMSPVSPALPWFVRL